MRTLPQTESLTVSGLYIFCLFAAAVSQEKEEAPLRFPIIQFSAAKSTAESAMATCKEYMEYLESIDVYDTKEVLNILKNIGRMYSFFKKSKGKIGSYLVELGFASKITPFSFKIDMCATAIQRVFYGTIYVLYDIL